MIRTDYPTRPDAVSPPKMPMPTAAPSAFARAIADEITALSQLEDDWDSDGALPPYYGAVSLMLALTEFLDEALHYGEEAVPLPDCFATPTGGIELFWQGEQFYLSLLTESSVSGEIIVLDGDGVTLSKEYHKPIDEAASYAVRRLREQSARLRSASDAR